MEFGRVAVTERPQVKSGGRDYRLHPHAPPSILVGPGADHYQATLDLVTFPAIRLFVVAHPEIMDHPRAGTNPLLLNIDRLDRPKIGQSSLAEVHSRRCLRRDGLTSELPAGPGSASDDLLDRQCDPLCHRCA